jgi:hypothetical protein
MDKLPRSLLSVNYAVKNRQRQRGHQQGQSAGSGVISVSVSGVKPYYWKVGEVSVLSESGSPRIASDDRCRLLPESGEIRGPPFYWKGPKSGECLSREWKSVFRIIPLTIIPLTSLRAFPVLLLRITCGWPLRASGLSTMGLASCASG